MARSLDRRSWRRGIVVDLVDDDAEAADAAALAQLLAQLLAPGVPDLYQGAEALGPVARRPRQPPAGPTPTAGRPGSTGRPRSTPADAWGDPDLRAAGLPRAVVLQRALRPGAAGPTPSGPGRTAATCR